MGYGHLPRVVKRVDIFVPLTGFNGRGKLGFTWVEYCEYS